MQNNRSPSGEAKEHILKLIYKFRFISSNQISKYRNTLNSNTNRILDKLVKEEFVVKRFNSSYRLQGRSAEYYLTNQGIKYLKNKYNLNNQSLHAMYNNSIVSEEFINKSLGVVDIFNSLRRLYKDKFNIYTKQEVRGVDGFIYDPYPDLYLQPSSKNGKEYFLDDMTATQLFIVKKRIKKYIEHYESDDWDGDIYPTVLLVLNTPAQEKQMLKYIENQMDNNYLETTDISFMVTTLKALKDNHPEHKIWTAVGSEELKSL